MAHERVEDAMTPTLRTVATTDRIIDAARVMASADVGDVIVTRDQSIYGIVTDRDIAVRAVAGGIDPQAAVESITSQDLTTVERDTPVEEAVRTMRDKAVRRLPVVEGGRPVGIVSIGDLAMEREPRSALAGISAAPPNR